MKLSGSRGFSKLVGKTITKIDARCINAVTIWTSTGDRYEINCDELHFGIPVAKLTHLPKSEKTTTQ